MHENDYPLIWHSRDSSNTISGSKGIKGTDLELKVSLLFKRASIIEAQALPLQTHCVGLYYGIFAIHMGDFQIDKYLSQHQKVY